MYSVMPWIASIAFFMQTLDASILITSLPKMADSLNESPLNLETAVICYSLTLAIFIPVSGFVSDRFGTRNIFIFSLGIFSLGSFCSAVSVSLFWLDVSRVIQGIGGAMMVPVSRLVLLKIFDKKQL
ncbi:MFS transporter, partial [Salmonella enterica subsp. enterica serovar Infantis]|nr:MFS transporter [Salmonella enterica subsp. enterica serovar Infantis]